MTLCIGMALLVLTSCSKILSGDKAPASSTHPGFLEYVILKGNHNAEGNQMRRYSASNLNFSVAFDSTAIYKTVSAGNQNDINKLFGISDCSTAHHENSARFGWRWNGHSIEILAYLYINNTRQWKLLGTTVPGKIDQYGLMARKNQYVFEFNEEEFTFDRGCDNSQFDGYLLYPYFGGDETAPHNISIHLRLGASKN